MKTATARAKYRTSLWSRYRDLWLRAAELPDSQAEAFAFLHVLAFVAAACVAIWYARPWLAL